MTGRASGERRSVPIGVSIATALLLVLALWIAPAVAWPPGEERTEFGRAQEVDWDLGIVRHQSFSWERSFNLDKGDVRHVQPTLPFSITYTEPPQGVEVEIRICVFVNGEQAYCNWQIGRAHV